MMVRAFRRFLHFLCLGWLILCLPAFGAPVKQPEARPLVVGCGLDVPPYIYRGRDGQPAGFHVEVIRAVARHQGWQIRFRQDAYPQLWEAFRRGEIDLVVGAVHSEARAQVMHLSVPYLFSHFVPVVRKDSGIRSETDLAHGRLLLLGNSVMMEVAKGRGWRADPTDTYLEGLRGVAAGRAEATVLPEYTWRYFARTGEFNQLQILEMELYPTKVCLAMPRERDELLARVNEALFLLKSDGTLDRLAMEAFGQMESEALSPRLALRRLGKPLLLGLGACFLLVMLGWILSLRRLVRLRTADLQATVAHLEAARDEVKQLSGLLPICAHCKKIRDEGGAWSPMEVYITARSEAAFTHGICPDCAQALRATLVREP